MDISKFNNSRFMLPHIGEVDATLFSFGVYKKLEETDWDNPYQFVRMLLSQHTEIDERPPTGIEQLSEGQLDEIACAIWLSHPKADEPESDDEPVEVSDASTLLAAYRQELKKLNTAAVRVVERQIRPALKQAENFRGLLERMNQNSVFDRLIQPSAFEQLQRSLAQYDRLNNQLSHPVVPDFQRIAQRLTDNSSFSQMTKRHQAAMQGLSAVMESFRSTDLAIQSVTRTLNVGALSAAVASASAISPGSAFYEIVEQGLRSPGFSYAAQAAVAGLASQSATAEILAHYYVPTDEFSDGFARTLEGIHELDVAKSEDLSEQQADEILEAILERLVSLESASKWMHPQNVMALAILLIAVATLYFTVKSPTAQQIETLQLQNERLIQLQFEDLHRNEQRYRYDRRLTGRYYLREAPDGESPDITLLNSDQIVAVERTEGDWAFVRVYPYANENEIKGWVHRNGLAPLSGN